MDNSDRVQIPGSELRPGSEDRILSPADASQDITVTILLRRNSNQSGQSEQDLLSGKYQTSSQGQAAARASVAADPGDVAAVRSFAQEYGLRIVEEDPASRRVRVEGTASSLEKAFGVELQQSQGVSGGRFLTYTGAITVPKALNGIVTAVLGLDQRPVAAPRSP